MKHILLLLVLILTVHVSSAQQTAITGKVADTTGAAVSGATVHAQQVDGAGSFVTTTNALGSFQFPALKAATYLLRVESDGFARSDKQLTLLVGQTLQVPFTLHLATTSSQVVVTSESNAIDTTSSQVAGNVDQETVEKTPLNGRNYLQLGTLLPGIRVNAADDSLLPANSMGAMQLNIDGQQVTQNYAYAVYYGQPKFSLDAIGQFQVITNRFDATQGRSSQLQVNVQTKSGSNKVHGSAFGYFRNDVFNAADPTAREVLPYSDEQYGGTIGGPILKDKLFYFGSYEREHRPNTLVSQPYGFESVLPVWTKADTITTDEYLGRFDYARGGNDHFSLRASGYTFADPYNGVSGTANPSTLGKSEINNYGVLLTYNTVRGPQIVSDLKVGYTHNETSSTPYVSSQTYDFPSTQIGYEEPEIISQEITSVRDDAYWLHGKHSVKFGGEYLHQLLHGTFGRDRLGVAAFNSDPGDFPAIFPNLFDPSTWNLAALSPLAQSYSQSFGPEGIGIPTNTLGFWFQDDWKIRERLTLNLGIRYDNDLGIFNPRVKLLSGVPLPSGGDNNNISPRVGFAWSPKADGKTVIRGGAGVYFSDIPRNMIQDTAVFNGQTRVVPSVQRTDGAPINLLDPFHGVTPQQILADPLAYKQTAQVMSPDVVTPWTAEVSIGAQTSALIPGVTISADYLHNRTHRDWIRVDANLYYDPATGYNKNPSVAGRPNPYYNALPTFETPKSIGGIYDALLVSIQRQLSHGLRVDLAYTLARQKDNNYSGPFTYTNNPFAIGNDWSHGNENQLHTIRLNTTYQWRYGLRAGALYNYGSGANFDVSAGGSPTGLGSYVSNRTFCGSDATNSLCSGNTIAVYNDPKHNRLDTRSGFDVTDRNQLVGRPIHRVDANLGKEFAFADRYRVLVQVEAFNLSNHSNFGSYNSSIVSPSYGQPSASSGTLSYNARMLQFSAHLRF